MLTLIVIAILSYAGKSAAVCGLAISTIHILAPVTELSTRQRHGMMPKPTVKGMETDWLCLIASSLYLGEGI
ncbi:hypothetical protein EB796_021284 [Bugula neritina]|uniref:Uncharacterized protein n=1 Tax=Bugula neritina TaxID=10212 RepID=A0A7J7J2K7_BUGNE|nr:hypothetical protein EB796_021284 [Bugula neritina]